MPGCVLHARGDDFQVDAFLANSDLAPYSVHRRGGMSRRARCYTDSGLSLDISSADGDLDAEVADAISFLSAHEAELQRLKEFPGVTDIRMDFGFYRRDVAAQFEYLSPDLLLRAGKLGIGIELSLYPPPQSEQSDVQE